MSKPKYQEYTTNIKGIDAIFQDFLDNLQLNKLSNVKTVEAYRTDNYMMFRFFMKKYKSLLTDGSFNKLERTHLEGWVDYMVHEKKYKEATLRRKKISMRQFLKYLYEENHISAELYNFFGVKQNKYQVPKNVPEPEEVFEFIDSIDNKDSFLRSRDSLMITLMYQTGVRTSELLNIKKSDFKGFINSETKEHLESLHHIPHNEHGEWVGLIYIIGKRGKHRYVLYSGDLANEINRYSSNRLYSSTSDYLFHSTHNKPMTRQNFFNRVKKYTKSGRFDPKKFTPHQFRHAFGSHFLKRPSLTDDENKDNIGFNLVELAELMGHSNLKATMIYTHLNDKAEREYFDKYHPRS